MGSWVALIVQLWLTLAKIVEQNLGGTRVYSSQQPKKNFDETHALSFSSFSWTPLIFVLAVQDFHMPTVLFGIFTNHQEKGKKKTLFDQD